MEPGEHAELRCAACGSDQLRRTRLWDFAEEAAMDPVMGADFRCARCRKVSQFTIDMLANGGVVLLWHLVG
jgi:hypothetical protein